MGVVLPVGRMTADQMDGLAAIAERQRIIRLTVWQNLLISDIDHDRIEDVAARSPTWASIGTHRAAAAWWRVPATELQVRGGDTKGNALALGAHLEEP